MSKLHQRYGIAKIRMDLAYGMKSESQLKPVTLYGYTANFLADNITIALFLITVWLLVLDENECVEADDGYRAADPEKVKSKSGHSSRYSSVNELDVKNRVRARHETVNKRIKQLSSLSGIFRHDLDAHSDFVHAACVLTQISISMGELLSQVEYNEMA